MYWGDVVCCYGLYIVIGIVWVVIVYWLNLSFLWWFLLVVGVLIVLILFLVFFSCVSLGCCM